MINRKVYTHDSSINSQYLFQVCDSRKIIHTCSWLPITRTLGNSNLPLTWSTLVFPLGHFATNFTVDNSNSWQLEPFSISFEGSSYRESGLNHICQRIRQYCLMPRSTKHWITSSWLLRSRTSLHHGGDGVKCRIRESSNLHGHGVMWHSAVSCPSPAHGFPPSAGAGLSHVRFLCTVPWPHVAEHALQLPHAAQFPSTVKRIDWSSLGQNRRSVNE